MYADLPELPEGWEWFDEDDPFVGVRCPHGNGIEIDSPQSWDGCRNPIYDLF